MGALNPKLNKILFLNCSTIGYEDALELNEFAKRKGLVYVDSPITGGVLGAERGSLTFIIGSPNQDVFKKVKDLARPMGERFVDCGGVGLGSACKLANNLALAIEMHAISEGILFGEKLGVKPQALQEVMAHGTAACWSVTEEFPIPGVIPNVPSSLGYLGGYKSRWMLKDAGLALNSAKKQGLKLRLLE